MTAMPNPPESTKTSLRQRLTRHAAAHWPQLAALHVHHHGQSWARPVTWQTSTATIASTPTR
jgi:hypothetical protein